MAILDQYGNPYRYTHKFAHAADRSHGGGPQYNDVLDDVAQLIPRQDRMTLQSLSRRLYTNFGIAKAAVDTKADFSIGKAWKPTFRNPDDPSAIAAKAWLEQSWFPLCEIRGTTYHWNECLCLTSQALDREGEAFILLTETEGGDPRIQLLPAHRFGQRKSNETKLEGGPYGGLIMRDGVVLNAFGRAVAYQFLGNKTDGSEDRFISARDLIHVFNPDYAEQERGIPAFTHALKDFLHCLQSTEFERIAQMMVSSLGLIEFNESGMPDDDPAFSLQAGSSNTNGITTQLYAGGQTRYFKANSGARLEQVKHDRPGDLWERFHDRLIRSALAGIKMPYSLWKPGQQGTAVREEVVRMRQAIEQRQGVIERVARRCVSYALGKAIDAGRLEAFAGFYDVSFTMPPRPTVDDGREMVGLLKAYEAGVINMTELQAYKGRTVEQHYLERHHEQELWREISGETNDDDDESGENEQ